MNRTLWRVCCLALWITCAREASGVEFGWIGTNSLALPKPGDHGLRILTPNLLELSLVTTKKDDRTPVSAWDFVGENFKLNLPSGKSFVVLASGKAVEITEVSFKRRPLYAPLKTRDLRILNHLYLHLGAPLQAGAKVEVLRRDTRLWDAGTVFEARMDVMRFNPAIHVNQVGYEADFPKRAMIGYYLGSAGELRIDAQDFTLIDSEGQEVFAGKLRRRPDKGFTYTPTPYQNVYEADFSKFTTPGLYRLAVEGMGASFPFRIGAGVAATFARTYALGLYHQRCGASNSLPFTRHTHEACHVNPAEVMTQSHQAAQQVIAEVSADAKQDPRHTAPQLKHSEASLFPSVRSGKVDVAGGHHDAGDYSKYTINSASLIHALVFAVDNFEGAAHLDNLGLPESNDGKSDLLQEAKWEADFLAKMQDQDGGFYFLVYPRDRRYEDDVLPDKGDPQIVWPKNTSATAAAVAALAEIGSSPAFRKQFPAAAEGYLNKALRGWAFLERAIERFGRDGAYQKLTHYGNEFSHDDELGWAAAALFAATGKKEFERRFIESYNPESTETRRWSWWPMFEGWGNATRTYAFAALNGRLEPKQMNSEFRTRCETIIHATAMNHVRFARETAYGTSFPDPNKANKNAGWYFSAERAFDMAVAFELREDEQLLDAIVSNLNYEAGCNPVNVAYITGLGWRRQREIVHQFAQNDQRVLPPSGLPIGNVQGGFAYLHHYKKELGVLAFPPDGAEVAPYPFYDRWGDSFNTTTEFVVVDQARGTATAAFLMARSKGASERWRPAAAQIAGLPKSAPVGRTVSARLEAAGIDLKNAGIVWEARDQEPAIQSVFTFTPKNVGEQWVEAEALLPDGRRVFSKSVFNAVASLDTPPNASRSVPGESTPETLALYHLDRSLDDAAERSGVLRLQGNAVLDGVNLSWMKERGGAALRFQGLKDAATAAVQIPAEVGEITLEAMIYINAFKGYNKGNAKILSLSEDWNSSIELIEDMYQGPIIRGGTALSIGQAIVNKSLSRTNWHHLAITIDQDGYTVRVNGDTIGLKKAAELENWGRKPAQLEFGNFDGYIDEVAIICKTSEGLPAGGSIEQAE